MSDTDHNGILDDDPRLVAGEYVLGVLDAPTRRQAAQRIEREADFAQEVALWEEQLGGLADSVQPVAPPEAVWSRIEASIGAFGAPAAVAQRAGLWQSLVFWRSLAIGSAALAAAAIAGLAYLGSGIVRDERAPLFANIGQQSGQPGFVAAIGSGGTMVVVPASLLTADQKSMELWLIPAGAQPRPRSLGLIAPNQPVRITVPPQLVPLVTPDAALAVSLEEPGGSRTGLPSNNIIASGPLTNL
jgi:anti-sigma-K factor RskA